MAFLHRSQLFVQPNQARRDRLDTAVQYAGRVFSASLLVFSSRSSHRHRGVDPFRRPPSLLGTWLELSTGLSIFLANFLWISKPAPDQLVRPVFALLRIPAAVTSRRDIGQAILPAQVARARHMLILASHCEPQLLLDEVGGGVRKSMDLCEDLPGVLGRAPTSVLKFSKGLPGNLSPEGTSGSKLINR